MSALNRRSHRIGSRSTAFVLCATAVVIVSVLAVAPSAWSLTSGAIYTEAGGPGIGSSSTTLSTDPYALAIKSNVLYETDPVHNEVRKLSGAGFATITNVAGNGSQGYSGDGGLATSAQLSGQIDGLVVDDSGNVYIADTGNNVIRKVAASTGDITTIAGNGTAGYSGDGGAATSAELYSPASVSLGSSGYVFIADTGNNVIRKIVGGTINTVAGDGVAGFGGDGGEATSAELSGPTSTVTDGDHNLYIADNQNARIREVNVTTSDISTVGGNGDVSYSGDGGSATSAELNDPSGVVVDSSGNVIFSDANNNVVRKLNVSSGSISTIAGNGSAGYSGDGGAATSATLNNPQGLALDSSGDLFIADSGNNVIREVSISTGDITTVAGDDNPGYSGDGGAATSAELNQPVGVYVDADGNVDIADSNNNVIRQVSPAGVISTIVGGPGSGTDTTVSQVPVGAAEWSGSLYEADPQHSVIRKIDLSTGDETVLAGTGSPGYSGDGGPASGAELNQPTGLAIDSSGDVFIADASNNVIREVSASTGDISTVAGDVTAGYTGDGGPATSAELDSPQGVAVDASGDLFIADSDNYVVREVAAATGDISTVAGSGIPGYDGDGGPATDAELNSPDSVAVDSAGNLWIADSENDVVREVSAATGDISTVAGDGTQGYSGDGGPATSAELSDPEEIALDGSGDLYIADSGNYRVREVVASSGTIETVAGDGTEGFAGDGGSATSAELSAVQGVAVDTSGNLLLADWGNNRVRVVNSAGDISTLAGNGFPSYSGDGGVATAAELQLPTAVAEDASGNMFIADSSNSVIREVSASTGDISTVAGTGTAGYSGDGGSATSAELNQPFSVVTGAGGIYISDSGNNCVRFVNLSTGDISSFAGECGAGGFAGDGAAATGAELWLPLGLAYDPHGNLWIVDASNGRIRVVSSGGTL